MAPTVCRAALKRSIGKVFYHAGFEDFQPSAMETVTDLASDYFAKLADCFKKYREPEKDDNDRPRFTFEEQVLHTLHEHGLDLDSLEMYVKDDVDRQSTKLGVVHDRMKSHLAELLVSLDSRAAQRMRTNCLVASGPRRQRRHRRCRRLQRWKRTIRRRRLCRRPG